MSPIKDLSEAVRLPRLGKIHLGIKHPEKGYPMKTDHFVLPADHSDYAKLVECFGEKPKELHILIPVEDAEQWATQYYKSYNQTYGLVCKGDGEVALRMADSKTGELPQSKVSTIVGLQEIPCAGKDCLDYQAKKCHEVMNLKFLIPEVPGLGVWQIDTGSKNSIMNINSCARIIKRAFGRISLIPLKLTFEPIQVNNPEDGKKQTAYVLNLRTDVTLAQLADQAREQAKMFMLEAPDLEAIYVEEEEKEIDALWGEKPEPTTVIKPETAQDAPQSKTSPTEKESNAVAPTPSPYQVEEEAPPTSPIDLDWVRETMGIIKWTEVTAKSWISGNLKVKTGDDTLEKILLGLPADKLQAFHKKLQDLRSVSGK